MVIRTLNGALICLLSLSPLSAFSDNTKDCSDQQNANCGRFCVQHGGVQSCVIDISKQDGTCTCTDGTSHTKSK